MRIQVRLFAGAREAVGAARVQLEVGEGATVNDAFAALVTSYPDVARWRDHVTYMLNRSRASPGFALADGDELALLPPVSGGGEGIATADADLSLDALVDGLDAKGAGAVVTFLGIVRGTARDAARVQALEFEAWEEEIAAELAAALARARVKFGVVDASIHHRLGRVATGERIVAIAVASAHRHAAFEACEFLVEELKRVVPIWKKEVSTNGDDHWVGDTDAGVPTRVVQEESS